MECTKEWHEDGATTWFNYKYRCVNCVESQDNLTRGAAWAHIFTSKGKSKFKLDEARKFAEAKSSLVETYAAFGFVKGNRKFYTLAKSFMTQMFGGIANAIVVKSKQMAAIANACAETQLLANELRTCEDPSRINALLSLIEEAIEDPDIPLLASAGSADLNRGPPPQTTGSTPKLATSDSTIYADVGQPTCASIS